MKVQNPQFIWAYACIRATYYNAIILQFIRVMHASYVLLLIMPIVLMDGYIDCYIHLLSSKLILVLKVILPNLHFITAHFSFNTAQMGSDTPLF